MVSGVLLYVVPDSNGTIQAVWVTCTYTLFFAISYTMYNLSNVITLPLSTRDGKRRDSLAFAQSIGANIVPGAIFVFIFPSFALPYMGTDQGRWIKVMMILGVLGFLGTLIQYFFVKERITEDLSKKISVSDQISGCCSSKYWLIVILVVFLYNLTQLIQVNAMVYYANWVVGTCNDGRTLTMLNIIGQSLLGPGLVIVWPAVKKIGKSLLSGNVFCGHCGGRIFSSTARKAHHPTSGKPTERIIVYKCYNRPSTNRSATVRLHTARSGWIKSWSPFCGASLNAQNLSMRNPLSNSRYRFPPNSISKS